MRVAEGYQSIWYMNALAGGNESFVRLTLWFMRTWQSRSVRKSVQKKNGLAGQTSSLQGNKVLSSVDVYLHLNRELLG